MRSIVDLSYGALPEQKLDLFIPEGECRATVLWFHGGGIEAGSRKGFDGIAAQLCGEGIGFVSAEYRMFPSARYPEFIQDCAKSAAWLMKHAAEYGLSEKILIGGSSAGAYLSMMLCFDRGYLVAEGVEPECFAGYFFDAGQPTTHFNVLHHRGEDARLCRIDEAAPLFHICDGRPNRPIQILYADNDMPARLEQNRLMVATLKHVGYDMSLVEDGLMCGYAHCGYDEAKDGESWILAEKIGKFVQRAIG